MTGKNSKFDTLETRESFYGSEKRNDLVCLFRFVWSIGICDLVIVWDLVLGI